VRALQGGVGASENPLRRRASSQAVPERNESRQMSEWVVSVRPSSLLYHQLQGSCVCDPPLCLLCLGT